MITTSDLPAIRSLIKARREAGWTVVHYGERGFRQHLYREPVEPAWSGAKVCVEPDQIEYRRRPADAHPGVAYILPRPETADEVVGWLLVLRLIEPTAEQVARAILQPDTLAEATA